MCAHVCAQKHSHCRSGRYTGMCVCQCVWESLFFCVCVCVFCSTKLFIHVYIYTCIYTTWSSAYNAVGFLALVNVRGVAGAAVFQERCRQHIVSERGHVLKKEKRERRGWQRRNGCELLKQTYWFPASHMLTCAICVKSGNMSEGVIKRTQDCVCDKQEWCKQNYIERCVLYADSVGWTVNLHLHNCTHLSVLLTEPAQVAEPRCLRKSCLCHWGMASMIDEKEKNTIQD